MYHVRHLFQSTCLKPHSPLHHSHLHPLCFSTTTISKRLGFPAFKHQVLSMFSSCKDAIFLKKAHGLLVVNGCTNDLLFQTKLVSLYGCFGYIESARRLFDGIPNPDLYASKVMLGCYMLSDRYGETIEFYKKIRAFVEGWDNVVFSAVLKACVRLLDIIEGKKIHGDIIKVGSPDCFLLNVLIDMYAKCGYMDCSRRVFDEIVDKNVVSWTSIISGYVQNDCPTEGLAMFNLMRQGSIKPSEYTMGTLLMACSIQDALHHGKWIHGYMIKNAIPMNLFVGTALLDFYVKYGEVIDARSVFDEIGFADLVFWTAMIVGYTQKGYPIEALKLFSDEKWADIIPNSVTIASALSASAQLREVKLGRSIHLLGIKLGYECSDVIRNALIDMYAKCSEIWEASSIFESISQTNVVTWNAMIAGFSQNDFGCEALSLFHRMRSVNCVPDAITVVSVLSACACLGSLSIGSCFHVYAIKSGFLANISVSTALLNLYNKCGDPVSARVVFDDMSDRNNVTWCAMVGGYGMQGDSVGSIDMFSKMLKENMEPNDVTFTSILSTCSHTGMVEEGQRYFDSMSRDYRIAPSMKHYACMVDMLARSGKLEEALEFIEKMPVQAGVTVWGPLLHGCRLHSRMDLGEMAVRKMMDLHPETADYYVLMSNFYALDGRWTEVNKIREVMNERGLIKSPGCSFVEMNHGLHYLALKDTSYTHGHRSGELSYG